MNKLFFFKDIDSHYVIYFLGIRLLLKHACPIKFQEIKEYSLTKEKRNPRIIVSLTSFPARISLAKYTINSIFAQTLKPDEIILWLEKEKFPNGFDDIPQEILDLQQYGLSIKWCDTLRSYCKLVPALKEYPDDIIVTIDDDVYYEPNLLENLYNAYLKNPKNIYSRRVVRQKLINNDLLPVSVREYLYKDNFEPTYKNQLMGTSGVLYPPHSLNNEVLNTEKFKKIIPTHDDIWFWAMAVLNKTKIQLVDGHNVNMYEVEGTQEFGLININKKGGSGISLEEGYGLMFKNYPEILENLKSE